MKNSDIEKIISELLLKTGIPFSDISFSFDENTGEYWYSVSLNESGHKTEELNQAINHLIKRVLEKTCAPEQVAPNVVFDINGFYKKKINNIRTIAHMMAERAKYFKSSVEIDPMSAYERKIVHEYLKDRPDIKTESTGEGLKRRVVVTYIDTTI